MSPLAKVNLPGSKNNRSSHLLIYFYSMTAGNAHSLCVQLLFLGTFPGQRTFPLSVTAPKHTIGMTEDKVANKHGEWHVRYQQSFRCGSGVSQVSVDVLPLKRNIKDSNIDC